MITNIYKFDSTAEAYDACNYGEVPRGHILVIESENVIGVSDIWPFAVTQECGDLHSLGFPATIPQGLEEGYRVACLLRDTDAC